MTTEAFNNNYFCKATGGELDKLASWFAASKPYADDPQIKAALAQALRDKTDNAVPCRCSAEAKKILNAKGIRQPFTGKTRNQLRNDKTKDLIGGTPADLGLYFEHFIPLSQAIDLCLTLDDDGIEQVLKSLEVVWITTGENTILDAKYKNSGRATRAEAEAAYKDCGISLEPIND